jgi:hypothetical protein
MTIQLKKSAHFSLKKTKWRTNAITKAWNALHADQHSSEFPTTNALKRFKTAKNTRKHQTCAVFAIPTQN